MGLAGYQPEVREFPLQGGRHTFSVRGLSLSDLAVLIRTHLPDLEGLFEVFQKGGGLDDVDVLSLATSLAAEAPGFTANVIALAAGEVDATNSAAALPFPVQVEALVAIGDLTFKEVGGVKKSLEMVTTLLMKTGMNKTLLAKTLMKAA